jgi:hypothetical protein
MAVPSETSGWGGWWRGRVHQFRSIRPLRPPRIAAGAIYGKASPSVQLSVKRLNEVRCQWNVSRIRRSDHQLEQR